MTIDSPMTISVEIVVTRGSWLIPCIESVLNQTSPDWEMNVLWNGGDSVSRGILDELLALGNEKIRVHFRERIGIAMARRLLTDRSTGDYSLPLDDDDVLGPNAVEVFLEAAKEKPWAGMLRARRGFIDEHGQALSRKEPFPFKRRSYFRGMTRDVYNHSQPYAFKRTDYARTRGWYGFNDMRGAGEDCAIFAVLEETAEVELIDEVVYYYRMNPKSVSPVLKAEELWQRIADLTVQQRGLPMRRKNERQPFEYAYSPPRIWTRGDVDFVLLETNREASRDAMTRRLLDCGIAKERIRIAPNGRWDSAALQAILPASACPLLCFVGAEIEGLTMDAIDELIEGMMKHDADLVGPTLRDDDGRISFFAPGFDYAKRPIRKTADLAPDLAASRADQEARWLSFHCLLMRRSVARCIGSLDPTYASDTLATADYGLRARSRDLRCVALTRPDLAYVGPADERPNDSEYDYFRRKWKDYPDLFAPLRPPKEMAPRR